MTSETLAVNGGTPVRSGEFPPYVSMGEDEVAAVQEVVRSQCLSGYYGSWGPEFLGGPQVKAFEHAWAVRFRVKHVVSVNSATSGLFAAIGAAGVGPGDEVIVPPYTMSATAMAPLVYGGIPVFADIEADTFCLDIEDVRAKITPRTKAVMVVNLFGHPGRLHDLRKLCDEKGLVLIEDNAQGPLAEEDGKMAGTIGHIGIFSLNYHKHIHTGEGGMCATDDDQLALKMQMIRNHAENIVDHVDLPNIVNMVGFQYRMTELSAAVGLQQLAHADRHIGVRQRIAERLSDGLRDLEGVTVPVVREGCRHVYYVWTAKLDEQALGVDRAAFSRALTAEGFPHWTGYVAPLYRLPLFKKRVAFGDGGYPFNLSDVEYRDGMCPVTERMHDHELLGFETCAFALTDADLDHLVEAFRKVHRMRHTIHSETRVGAH